MDAEEFQKIVKKSKVHDIVIAAITFLLGAGFIWLLIAKFEGLHWETTGGKIGTTFAFICGGILTILGTWLLYYNLKRYILISTGRHQLIRALNEPDNESVIWVYDKLHVNYASGMRYAQIHFTIYFANGERLTFTLMESEQLDLKKMRNFIASAYPNAARGYDERTRKQMKIRLGKKRV